MKTRNLRVTSTVANDTPGSHVQATTPTCVDGQ